MCHSHSHCIKKSKINFNRKKHSMKAILIGIVGVGVIGAGVWYFKKKKTKSGASAAGSAGAASASPAPAPAGDPADPLASLKQKVIDAQDPQWRDSVALKVELMNEQELKDMLRFRTMERAGIPLPTGDAGLTALQTKYKVFAATGKRNFMATGNTFRGLKIV
jgi:hypothetical protein